MNETLANEETHDPVPEPKLIGLPRPWAGAIIGILLFTVLLLLLQVKQPVFFSGLLYLGNLAVYLLGLTNDAQPGLNAAHDAPTYLIAYVVSCLPPAITGSLIASMNQVKRVFGCLVLIAYVVFLFFSAVVMAFVSLDF